MSPSRPLGLQIPQEIWTGSKPNYDKLSIFGCEAYAFIPNNKRRKLEPRSRKCVFLGYGPDGEIGYRLWDPEHRYSPGIFFTDVGEPTSYEEASAAADSATWHLAMELEMHSIRANKTWEPTCSSLQVGLQIKGDVRLDHPKVQGQISREGISTRIWCRLRRNLFTSGENDNNPSFHARCSGWRQFGADSARCKDDLPPR